MQHTEHPNETPSIPSPRLTFREQRRVDQHELRLKYPGRKTRGPTRGKKYAFRINRNSTEKVKINFMDELRRVVGEKADEFICDCSKWVKEFCPLNSKNWDGMDKDRKARLYAKIMGKYDLPERVGGLDVIEALSFQCKSLYRHYRFRLKEKHYRGKTIEDALACKPEDVDPNEWKWLVNDYWSNEKQKHISKVNTENQAKQTIKPANGGKSIARIFHDMLNEPPPVPNENSEDPSQDTENQQDPLYMRLYDKLKRHKKDGREFFDPDAEKNYQELTKLHETQIEKFGKDTLSVKSAFIEVLKPKSGYVRGLGPGARPPKLSLQATTDRDTTTLRVDLSAEIQHLKEVAAEKEVSLMGQLETLKESNEDLKSTNEFLKSSNEELKASLVRMEKEATMREKKMREDMAKMFAEFRKGF